MSRLLYTFYGDDFTGSTDVLERLADAGVRAALFVSVPTREDLESMPGLQAVGVAGESRSQSPEWMLRELPAVFRELKRLGAPVMQYKVCSTFDSSPEHGSIGCAMEVGLEVVGSRYVPVVVGAPHLRRFVWEGKLFAADAVGEVHRIDRHPMSRHPVTPMKEPSLRAHLEKQTRMRIGEVGAGAPEELGAAIAREVGEGCRAIVFDAFTAKDLSSLGQVIWHEGERGPLFAVGSSGLTAALIAAWVREGSVEAREESGQGENGGKPLLVVSGSCSPMTERQVRWAVAHDFCGLEARPESLHGDRRRELLERAVERLRSGQDVVVYTALGAPGGESQGDALGTALGSMLEEVLAETGLRRVLLCGGDTSSQAVKRLGVRALTFARALQAGVPLCRVHANGSLDGLELALKGGQVGTEDFFAVVRDA